MSESNPTTSPPSSPEKSPPKRLLVAVVIAVVVLIVALVVWQVAKGDNNAGESKGARPPVALPFAANSVWRSPIAQDATVDPNSAAYVNEFARQISQYYGTVNINTDQYTPPVYIVGADVPTTKVEFNDCQKKGVADPGFMRQMSAVPLPADAVASKGSDAELTVWQPSSDTLWELWQAKKNANGSWSACWGGRLERVSQSNGTFPAPYGTTASGLTLLGGLIRPAEIDAGRIDHAIAVSLVDIKAGTFVPPANRTDGASTSPNAIAEGQRFQLDPSVDVDKLPMSRAGKVIAHAIQTYGLIVRDHSGAVTLYAENIATAKSADDPTPYATAFDGKPSYDVMKGFPWTKLRALAPQ